MSSKYELQLYGNAAQVVFLGHTFIDSMPTAIVVAYTDEGFVAVSDGLATNKYGQKMSETEQKIFPIRSPSYQLVLGVSGAASLLEKHEKWNNSPRKDIFKKIFCDVIKEMAGRNGPDSLDEFVANFISETKSRILPYLDEPFSNANGQLKTRMVFAGYFNGVPCLSDVALSLGRGVFEKIDEFGEHLHRVGKSYIVGSKTVALHLVLRDKFHEFTTPNFEKIYHGRSDLSLFSAVYSAKKYISACDTPEAKTLCEYCNSIGGHKSVAAITLEDGFKWLDEPKNPYIL